MFFQKNLLSLDMTFHYHIIHQNVYVFHRTLRKIIFSLQSITYFGLPRNLQDSLVSVHASLQTSNFHCNLGEISVVWYSLSLILIVGPRKRFGWQMLINLIKNWINCMKNNNMILNLNPAHASMLHLAYNYRDQTLVGINHLRGLYLNILWICISR